MRAFIIASTAGATLFSSAALTQEPSQGRAPIPDFSGIWSSPYFGVDRPISGTGPLGGRPGTRNRIVGDYNNPILKPHAAQAVKKAGEMELSGVSHPNPRNQCWPEGLPFAFVNPAILMGAVRNVVGICVARLRQIEFISSSGEVNWLIGGLGGERLPAIDFAHVDLS